MCLAYNIAAEELWDDESWRELASSQVELARATGTLLLLPYALDYLAGALTQAGEFAPRHCCSPKPRGWTVTSGRSSRSGSRLGAARRRRAAPGRER